MHLASCTYFRFDRRNNAKLIGSRFTDRGLLSKGGSFENVWRVFSNCGLKSRCLGSIWGPTISDAIPKIPAATTENTARHLHCHLNSHRLKITSRFPVCKCLHMQAIRREKLISMFITNTTSWGQKNFLPVACRLLFSAAKSWHTVYYSFFTYARVLLFIIMH